MFMIWCMLQILKTQFNKEYDQKVSEKSETSAYANNIIGYRLTEYLCFPRKQGMKESKDRTIRSMHYIKRKTQRRLHIERSSYAIQFKSTFSRLFPV